MTIVLDHTIVPARDRSASATILRGAFGLPAGEPVGPFAPVQVNASLTFDFDDRRPFEIHHYAFHVSDASSTPSSAASRRAGSSMAAIHTTRRTCGFASSTAAARSTSRS